ncbi:DUF1194 domain-containing protein [Roseobacter sp. CCS2]|uniref:DUF1194 domain-containing protein n=1 Tax=Roseobacter sp. CCS2 TaxID=391593 RepID=UPI0000F3E31F|nr:DUF1194 domain-containing protein [Roseobacter sp. CCS2]EBA12614.1 von Willebrand factor type A domain prot [Roseobacter sp. CCS2]
MALILAVDVSSSVDADEYILQRNGLANALRTPEVEAAFFASPQPVALQIFEWSGRGHQTDLLDWTLINTPADLRRVAATLTRTTRSTDGLPTAMGHALGYAAIKLQNAPACLFQTIDLAGDGTNNESFGPRSVYATFPFDGVVVNGLAITGTETALENYFETQVIRGPTAFVEVAQGFQDFENAMRRKLVRELSAQIIGRAATRQEVQG